MLTAATTFAVHAPEPVMAGPTIDGAMEGIGYARAGSVTKVRVAGRGGVPANADAAAINLTVTAPVGPGYASVWACGVSRPNASTINFAAGETIANATITDIGTNGDVCIYTSQTTHLIADVTGYFAPGSGYHALRPGRLADTRGGDRVAPGSVTKVRVAGRRGVPIDAKAASINLTITAPARAGFATVWACGTRRPNASTINFAAGETIANASITDIGLNGRICIYTSRATHLITDVTGYFAPGSGYDAQKPARLLDSRPGAATIDGSHLGAGRAAADSVTRVQVAGRGGIPNDADAASINLTITAPAGAGYATVWACGVGRPNASIINFAAGETIANAAITDIGTNGRICIYTSQTTHLITDVTGHFRTNSGYHPLRPARLLDSRPTDPSAVADERSKQLLDELRASLGAQGLTIDPAMSEFAREWSRSMAGSWFHHSGGPWSENIAAWADPRLSAEQAAAGLHQAWVNSPPHYANMTNGNYTHVGVGFHYDPNSGWWATHVFR